MSSSQEVYTQIAAKLKTTHPNLHWRRLTNWIWIIVGLVQGQSVHLSQIALHIPSPASEAGRIARIRRWLANLAINTRQLYDPLIREVLQAWRGREVTIILDGCFIRHKNLQMLRLSLSHCFRALPLTWKVVSSKGNVEVEVGEPLLRYAAELLSHTRRVTFLADRGFRGREWARLCKELGWRYMIRLANTTLVTFPDGRKVALDKLGIRPGKRFYAVGVRLTEEADWRCNLAITWTTPKPGQPAELCAVITGCQVLGCSTITCAACTSSKASVMRSRAVSISIIPTCATRSASTICCLQSQLPCCGFTSSANACSEKANGQISTRPTSDNSASFNSAGEHSDALFRVLVFPVVRLDFDRSDLHLSTEAPSVSYSATIT